MKHKSVTSNAAFPLFALSLSASLLLACAVASADTQQSSHAMPTAPPANKPSTLSPSHKDSKPPVSPPKSGGKLETQRTELGAQMLAELLTTRNTLQRQLTEAMQEEQSLRLHFAILQKKSSTAQPQPDAQVRAQNLRQLEEVQVKLASKQAFILTLKQRLEQNNSTMQSLFPNLSQKKPGAIIIPQEPGVEGRTLLFTPADKTKLVKRNLLLTPEDQKRVKVLPKGQGSPIAP